MAEVIVFQTGFRVDDSLLQPGDIFRKADDSLWEVLPDSSQAPLGGGGSLPDEWTVGANGQLEIAPTAADDVNTLVLRQAVGDDTRIQQLYDADGVLRMEIYSDGDGVCGISLLNGAKNFINLGGVYLGSDGSIGAFTPDFEKVWGSTPGGDGIPREYFKATPAPDDADVQTSQHINSYDDTPGANGIRFKQKDSDGTLSSGQVAALVDDGSAFLNITPQDLSAATTVAEVIAALTTLGLATS